MTQPDSRADQGAGEDVERVVGAEIDPGDGDGRGEAEHQRAEPVTGSGERHGDLLRGLLRHTLHVGDAADGQQRDVRCADTVAARGPNMTELVQDDDARAAADRVVTRAPLLGGTCAGLRPSRR